MLGDELTVGVRLHLADADFAVSALLEVARVGDDDVMVVLRPLDGTDEAAIHMSMAAAAVVSAALGRVRWREAQRG